MTPIRQALLAAWSPSRNRTQLESTSEESALSKLSRYYVREEDLPGDTREGAAGGDFTQGLLALTWIALVRRAALGERYLSRPFLKCDVWNKISARVITNRFAAFEAAFQLGGYEALAAMVIEVMDIVITPDFKINEDP